MGPRVKPSGCSRYGEGLFFFKLELKTLNFVSVTFFYFFLEEHICLEEENEEQEKEVYRPFSIVLICCYLKGEK